MALGSLPPARIDALERHLDHVSSPKLSGTPCADFGREDSFWVRKRLPFESKSLMRGRHICSTQTGHTEPTDAPPGAALCGCWTGFPLRHDPSVRAPPVLRSTGVSRVSGCLSREPAEPTADRGLASLEVRGKSLVAVRLSNGDASATLSSDLP